jgi:hypothetical protein
LRLIDKIFLNGAFFLAYMWVTETNIHRMRVLSDLLEEIPLSPNLLEIGAGHQFGHVESPIEPYFIAAIYQHKELQYNMTIVDTDHKTINLLRRNKEIMIPRSCLRDLDSRLMWNTYLKNASVASRNCSNFLDLLSTYIEFADIPSSFNVDDNISLVNSPIQKMNFETYGLVVAMSVFYQIPHCSQREVFQKISSSMIKDSYFIFTDQDNTRKKLRNNPVFQDFGGWMTKQELRKIGLTLDYWHIKNNESTHYGNKEVHPYGVAVVRKL